MRLTGITDLIAGLEPFEANVPPRGSHRAFGLLAAAKPAVAAALASRGRTVLVVTAHPQSAHDLADEIRFWTDEEVRLFPAIESLPYERVVLDRTVLAARESAVRDMESGIARIVVAPARALLQRVRSTRAGAPAPSFVRVGDTVNLDELLKGWVQQGYADVPTVEEPGTFARRGGVVDIYPAGADAPVRIELFGNEVESMRTFDPVTQRSTGPAESVHVEAVAALSEDTRLDALAELVDIDTSSLTAEGKTAWLDDLGRLERGAPFEEIAVFSPYLLRDAVSLVENLPADALVVVDTARETWELLDHLAEQAEDVQRGLEESGVLPAGLLPAVLPVSRVREGVSRLASLEWYSGSPEADGDLDWSEIFMPVPAFAGRVPAIVKELASPSERATVVTSYQHERIADLLAEENIPAARAEELREAPAPGITLLPASLSEGWALPSARIALFTDHELFGRPRARAPQRKRRQSREAFFANFSPGDYVVHLEHGIGRFDSVTRMNIDGAEREYAVIQYAGTDRVYVPTDQLERLTRYIGSGESPPQLNRLGGGEWQRARSRAKAAAAEIAKELIEVYAKRRARPAHAFSPDSPWQHELESSFPFEETPDQAQAIEDVKADMEEPHPMDRLVCADVGYGKTEVAVRAAFKAVMDGKQVAVLVPTTILAQQHMETFTERFAAFPMKVEALSRFRSPAQQKEILRRLAAGEVDVVIGTHRLLQKDVHFKNLGLLVIDEEQRFGVRHKEALKKMREAIDVLTLTATPIPRTLHMGLVGIREISVIETPPEGRLPIRTYLQPYDDRLLREAIVRELDRDGQVYIVHNRVATIEAMAERIRRVVPEARVIVAHGQMDETQLERAMLMFAHHEADVLLCSTIIENGLDIPNVNTIVITNAHRLGLTQLYQLRGRVGRSENQAYAYLLYPRDVHLSHDAARRMEAVFEARDLGAGMSIAMRDLEIRGVGNLLGAEQSGHANAIGFDLYTRLIGEEVERLRGVHVEEAAPVSIDVPLTMYLPPEYVGNESERLTLYRRLAGVESGDDLVSLTDEMRDRFGPLPVPVENLVTSIRIKLAARAAGVTSVSVGTDWLTVRSLPSAVYDRVSLYRRYGTEARISTNVLRIPRQKVGEAWVQAVQEILADMTRLAESLKHRDSITA